MQDGYIVRAILIDHRPDPLLIILVVLRGLRLVSCVFLGSVLLRSLINQLLLLGLHRSLEDINSGVCTAECTIA